MHSFNKFIFGLALFTILAAAGVANAVTLQVDSTFPDPPQNGQFRTINEAVAAAQTGDTIQVATGTYTDAVNISVGVKLQGSGPQSTFLTNTITVSTTDAVKISGFNITSLSNTGYGIWVTAPSAQLDIYNNCIAGNSNHGIYYLPSGGSTTPTHYLNITNNTITDNGYYGAYIGASYGTVHSTITNNIFSNNYSYGVYMTTNYADTNTSVNNIFYQNHTISTVQYVNIAPTPLSLVGVNPLFADGSHGDYTLQNGSPGRFAGTVSASYLNPDGTQSDLGAFGGPGAAAFWPYGYGPIVTGISADQLRVTQGASITISATATVR
jgi:hypothetical protein